MLGVVRPELSHTLSVQEKSVRTGLVQKQRHGEHLRGGGRGGPDVDLPYVALNGGLRGDTDLEP